LRRLSCLALACLTILLIASAATATAAKPVCNDNRDNDSDGKVDYPSDPGCTSKTDNSETDAVAPPPPPSNGVLWKADAEDVLENEWASVSTNFHCAQATYPGISDPRVTHSDNAAQGSKAWRLQLVDGDSCYGERAEMGMGNATRSDMLDRLFREGEERWISWQMYLEPGFNTNPGTWQDVMQLKQLGSYGSPVMGLYVENGQWQLQRTTSNPLNQWPSGFQKTFNLGTPRTGVWVKWTWHVKFSPDASVGFLEIYGDLADGQGMRPLFPETSMSTMKIANDIGQVLNSHARIGPYRNGTIAGNAAVLYDGYTVATSREAAEANAFSS
jgi:Polysaccharide lyase